MGRFLLFSSCALQEKGKQPTHLTAKVQQNLPCEMRRIFFAIMEKRLWNKSSGNKIRNKYKGETCSLHDCLYGTFTAKQGKTQWPWTSLIDLYFYEKIVLSSVFCCLKCFMLNESTGNVYTHQWFLQEKSQGMGSQRSVPEIKVLLWEYLTHSVTLSSLCFTTDLHYSMLNSFSIGLSRNRGP